MPGQPVRLRAFEFEGEWEGRCILVRATEAVSRHSRDCRESSGFRGRRAIAEGPGQV
jgi:hypothetical protein